MRRGSNLGSDPSKSFRNLWRGGIVTVFLAIFAFVLAWMFLPSVPLGEWAWIVRAGLSLVVSTIVAYVVWFIVVLRAIKEGF